MAKENNIVSATPMALRRTDNPEFLSSTLRDVDARLENTLLGINPVIGQAKNNIAGTNIIGSLSATVYTQNDVPNLNFAGVDDNIERVIAKIRFSLKRRCKQRYARILYSGGLAVTLITAGFTTFTFRLYRNGTLVANTINETYAATTFRQATFMFVDNLIPLAESVTEYEYQIRGIKADAAGDFSALVQQAAITLDFFRQGDLGAL